MKKKLQALFITILLSITGCGFNPNYVDKYNHQYDDLEVSQLESVYSNYTYKDFDKNNFYTELGWPFSYTPSIGEVNYIVVPLWFTDSKECIALSSREKVREDIQKSFFGTESDTGWESVSTYYYKDSFEKLNLDGVVTEWYETNKSISNYFTDGNATQTLVKEVYDWIVNNNKVDDLTKYDADSDGFLDGLVLVYGYHNANTIRYIKQDYKDRSNLWAYTSSTMNAKNKNVEQPGPNIFFWTSYDFMYGSEDYTATRTGKSKYGAGDTSNVSVDTHTFIHETGHMFGLNDYYDYAGEHSYSLGFSMQDYDVGAHDPFSRFSLGWAKAIVPTETVKVALPLMEESGTFVLLTPEYNNSAFDEYLALELYSPTGLNELDSENHYLNYYPKGPLKVGVRLWHVDSRLIHITKYNMFTFNVKSYELTSNPTLGTALHATSNTTYNGKNKDRTSDYAGSYDYKQLTVIRNNYKQINSFGIPVEEEARPEVLLESDLFYQGDYFSFHNYRAQFVNGEALNSERNLGWNFYIDKITSDYATITLIKY